MALIPEKGLTYTVADVVNVVLPQNKGKGQTWSQVYYDDHNSVAAWATDDDLLRAQLFDDGVVRVCYKSWLTKHSLLDPVPASAEKAPVEDDALDGERRTSNERTAL